MIQRRKQLTRKTPLKRSTKPMKRVSAKRAKESRIYAQKRKAFLEAHPFCEVFESVMREAIEGWNLMLWEDRLEVCAALKIEVPRSTDIHHTRGRSGTNYLDESTWLAVCRENHERIHKNPSWARANGFLF